MKWIAAALLMALAMWSCKDNEEDNRPPAEYHLTVGDSVITIPGDAVVFANTQFSVNAYLLREYQVAHDTIWPQPGSTFGGGLDDWKAMIWSARQTFLLSPYTHDVETQDNAQYYYMIGTYFDQFGYGWRDTFDPEANLQNPAVDIWLHPADSTLAPDNPLTIGFDGESHLIGQYREKWRFQ